MMQWIWLLVPASYLVGTFPSAELAARANGIDIRHTGSGNPGASNVTRSLGWKWGSAVLAFDAVKGAAPTALGWWVDGRPFAYVLLVAAIVGHMFPIWRGLRGGKGVATAAGGFFVLIPVSAVVGAFLWLAVSRWSKKASLASLVLMALAPIAAWWETRQWWEALAVAGISLLVASRHTGNIRRLIDRSEPSLSK